MRHFIGINPSVTVEPFYERGELDVNILPVVYQRVLSKRMDLRFTSILNLGIRNTGTEISHFGLETALPIFLRAKASNNQASSGLYVAPIVSLTQNRIEDHNNLGLWAEAGYSLLFKDGFMISFGLQSGLTYFSFQDNQTNWGSHFGVKIILGKWV